MVCFRHSTCTPYWDTDWFMLLFSSLGDQGGEKKRKKGASFQTVSSLHKVCHLSTPAGLSLDNALKKNVKDCNGQENIEIQHWNLTYGQGYWCWLRKYTATRTARQGLLHFIILEQSRNGSFPCVWESITKWCQQHISLTWLLTVSCLSLEQELITIC